MSKDLVKERTRPRYLEDGGVGRRRRPGDQRSRHRCGGDERACACGHRREGVVDLHGGPQGVADALLLAQRWRTQALCQQQPHPRFLQPGFATSSKRVPPALQRLLEDHRDNCRGVHPRSAAAAPSPLASRKAPRCTPPRRADETRNNALQAARERAAPGMPLR